MTTWAQQTPASTSWTKIRPQTDTVLDSGQVIGMLAGLTYANNITISETPFSKVNPTNTSWSQENPR